MFANFIQTLRGTPEQEQGFVASPETIKARRAMARKLLEGSVDTSPVAHWTQGAARMAQALQGVTADWATDREEKSAQADAAKMYAGLPGMLGAPSVAANPAPVGNPMSGGGPVNINPQSPAAPSATNGQIAGIDDRYDPEEAVKELAAWNENGRPDTLTGLNPQKAVRLAAFLEDNPHEATIGINSGYRSPERQAELYQAAVQKYGSEDAARKWVAPPGKSQHGHGNAVDLAFDDPKAQEWAHANAGKYGLAFPMKHEPWHVEMAGARDNAPMAQRGFANFAGVPKQEGAPQPSTAPQTGQQSEVFKRALTMMSSPAFQWLNPGQQAVVQNIVNKGMAQETADPVKQALTQEQLDAARMANAETRRRAGQTEMETQIIGGNLYEREKGSGGQWKMAVKKSAEDNPAKRSLQPIYGTNEAGETVLLQPDDAGNANQMKLPPGVKVANGIEKLDTGTEFILMDRKTGQVVGRQAKDVAGKEVQEAVGAAQGKIAAAAPNAISTAEQTLKEIQEVKKHPSNTDSMFGGGVGAPGVLFRSLPGTQAYGFNQRIEQLKGKTFMEAYNGLRGGGAITDAEGAKATQALARLNAAQSAKDFNEALGDLESIVTGGLARAKEMGARFGTVKPQQAAPSAPQVRKFNPATGAIE